MDINKIIFSGRLTKDVLLSKSKNNVTFCKNDLAVKGLKDQTVFAPVTFYNKTAENVANFCRKGSRIMVEASYNTGSYIGQDGKKIYTHGFQVTQVYFLDNKSESRQVQQGQEGSSVVDNGDSYSFANPDYTEGPTLDISSDDLPF